MPGSGWFAPSAADLVLGPSPRYAIPRCTPTRRALPCLPRLACPRDADPRYAAPCQVCRSPPCPTVPTARPEPSLVSPRLPRQAPRCRGGPIRCCHALPVTTGPRRYAPRHVCLAEPRTHRSQNIHACPIHICPAAPSRTCPIQIEPRHAPPHPVCLFPTQLLQPLFEQRQRIAATGFILLEMLIHAGHFPDLVRTGLVFGLSQHALEALKGIG